MLTVIHGPAPKPKLNMNDLYFRAWAVAFSAYAAWHNVDKESTEAKELRKKALFLGVKYLSTLPERRTFIRGFMEPLVTIAELCTYLFGFCTPSELLTMFPVKKDFDGERRGLKDYFFTMKELEAHGMDAPLAGHVHEVLWDYWNDDIRNFVISYLSICSDAGQAVGLPSIEEQWAEKTGVRMFYQQENPLTGAKYFFNPQNGRTSPVLKKKPRTWALVQGGKRLN